MNIVTLKPALVSYAVECVDNARFVFGFSAEDAEFARSGDDLVLSFENGATITLNGFYTTYTLQNMPVFEVDGAEVAGGDLLAALDQPDLMPAAGPTPANESHYQEWSNMDLLGGLDRLGGLDVAWQEGGVLPETEGGAGGSGDDGQLMLPLNLSLSVSEGGTKNDVREVVFTVTLDRASEADITVSLSNGHSVTIPAGSTSGRVTIATRADDIYTQADDVYSATIEGVSGGTSIDDIHWDSSSVSASITDDVDKTVFTIAAAPADEADGELTFTVTAGAPAQGDATVTVEFNGQQYNVTIADGATTGTFTAPNPETDDVYKDAESYIATIKGVDGGNYEGVTLGSVEVTIADTTNETTLTIKTSDVDESDNGVVTFEVEASNVPNGTATVFVKVDGEDGLREVILDAEGKGSFTVSHGNGEDIYKDASTIKATIESIDGGNYESVTGLGTSATANIADTDTPVTLTLVAPKEAVEEGDDAVFTLQLSQSVDRPLTVTLSDGQTVTIPANSDSIEVTTSSRTDDLYRQGEGTVSLSITGVSGASVEGKADLENFSFDGNAVTATVIDDADKTPFTITAVPADEDDSLLTFTVKADAKAQGNATVTVEFNGETYTAIIKNGDLTGTFTAPNPEAEDIYVDPETYTATIKNVTGGGYEAFAPSSVSVTIADTVNSVQASISAGEVNAGADGELAYNVEVKLYDADGNAVSNETGSDLVFSLSNGSTVTIASGESSGKGSISYDGETSIAISGVQGKEDASADGVINYDESSKGFFESLSFDSAESSVVKPDEAPEISVSGVEHTVYEAGLAVGSKPSQYVTSVDGSVTITDADSDSIPVTITDANGTAVNVLAEGAVVQGKHGTLSNFSFDASGKLSYTYTLNDAADHSAGDVSESFTITAGTGTATDTATIVVEVVDDVPSIKSYGHELTEDSGSYTVGGNAVADLIAGADRVTGEGFAWTSSTADAKYGSITLNADGTYSYTLNNAHSAVQALGDGDTLTETFNYTYRDADGDPATGTVTITINGTDEPVKGKTSFDTQDVDVRTLGSDSDFAELAGFTISGTELARVNATIDYGYFSVKDGNLIFTQTDVYSHPTAGSTSAAHNESSTVIFNFKATDAMGKATTVEAKVTIQDVGPAFDDSVTVTRHDVPQTNGLLTYTDLMEFTNYSVAWRNGTYKLMNNATPTTEFGGSDGDPAITFTGVKVQYDVNTGEVTPERTTDLNGESSIRSYRLGYRAGYMADKGSDMGLIITENTGVGSIDDVEFNASIDGKTAEGVLIDLGGKLAHAIEVKFGAFYNGGTRPTQWDTVAERGMISFYKDGEVVSHRLVTGAADGTFVLNMAEYIVEGFDQVYITAVHHGKDSETSDFVIQSVKFNTFTPSSVELTGNVNAESAGDGLIGFGSAVFSPSMAGNIEVVTEYGATLNATVTVEEGRSGGGQVTVTAEDGTVLATGILNSTGEWRFSPSTAFQVKGEDGELSDFQVVFGLTDSDGDTDTQSISLSMDQMTANNDVIFGTDGVDSLFGGVGVDFIDGGDGADTLDGGSGSDIFVYDPDDVLVQGGDGLDFLLGNDATPDLGDLLQNGSVSQVEILVRGLEAGDLTDARITTPGLGLTAMEEMADKLGITVNTDSVILEGWKLSGSKTVGEGSEAVTVTTYVNGGYSIETTLEAEVTSQQIILQNNQ